MQEVSRQLSADAWKTLRRLPGDGLIRLAGRLDDLYTTPRRRPGNSSRVAVTCRHSNGPCDADSTAGRRPVAWPSPNSHERRLHDSYTTQFLLGDAHPTPCDEKCVPPPAGGGLGDGAGDCGLEDGEATAGGPGEATAGGEELVAVVGTNDVAFGSVAFVTFGTEEGVWTASKVESLAL